MFARRGHQRCHCNEEGFGTLSRQLGNDEGYLSSRVGVSGLFSQSHRQMAAAAAVEGAKHARNAIGRLSDTGPGFDAWARSAPRSDRASDALPASSPKHGRGYRLLRLIE